MLYNIVRILVVEDNSKHLRDAKNYTSQLSHCLVDYATTLDSALLLLETNTYHGIISDVFFPDVQGGCAETFNNALTINDKALDLKIHIVFNTNGNHHGNKYRKFVWKTPVAVHNDHNYHFLTTGMIIESYPEESNDELDFKQWQAVFRYILLVHEVLTQDYKIPKENKLENGDSDYVFSGFPYGEYGQQTEKFNKTQNPFALSVFSKYNT
jgi:CheY-like chemotaxis protein